LGSLKKTCTWHEKGLLTIILEIQPLWHTSNAACCQISDFEISYAANLEGKKYLSQKILS